MELSHDTCYRALVTHDARFDGAFFVGVASTGIYCRPVCPARTPKPRNCSFYVSAASAERSGYRPCLRCRPELAPGSAAVDAVSRLAAAAMSRIEDGALSAIRVEVLAAELGVSDRHLRRVVEREFGVTPVELAQTHRLLHAKRLLTDTDLPIVEVAFAAGFASLRRFNALFRERYRMSPSDLRRGRRGAVPDALTCEIACRPPFDWGSAIAFLGARAWAGVERITDDEYARTVSIDGHTGLVRVTHHPSRDSLALCVSAGLAPVLVQVRARVKRLFDVAADTDAIAERLGALAARRPGLRVPGAFDGFEMTLRAILGQQVSVKAATTLAGRLAAAFGTPMEAPEPGLTHLSPTPERLVEASPEAIAAIGLTGTRARTLWHVAQAKVDGRVRLDGSRGADVEMAELKRIPGIGEWTAQYVAMRALSWPDAFPHTDLGVMKALGTRNPVEVLAAAEAWRPWRAYATMHLWRSREERP